VQAFDEAVRKFPGYLQVGFVRSTLEPMASEPRTIDELRVIADKVPGWLFRGQDELLYNLAKACPKGLAIVEIGSWKGRSTVYLAWGSKRGNWCPVYAVDHHLGSEELLEYPGFGERHPGGTFPEFWRNMQAAGVEDVVVPLVADSVKGAQLVNKPIGLLFIDGAHNAEAVIADFRAWAPKMAVGGYVAFHDYDNRQFTVQRGVDAVLADAVNWETLGTTYGIRGARRR